MCTWQLLAFVDCGCKKYFLDWCYQGEKVLLEIMMQVLGVMTTVLHLKVNKTGVQIFE